MLPVHDVPTMSKKPERTPKPCLCGCDETTGGGDFRPGHDARYKSKLVTAALEGDQAAIDKLEQRNWTKFLDKARNRGTARTERTAANEELTSDGLPKNATRPGDLEEEEFVKAICSGRQVVVRRLVGSVDLEETIRFRDPFHRSERVGNGNTYRMVPTHPTRAPLADGILQISEEETGGRRSIRLTDVAGVLNK